MKNKILYSVIVIFLVTLASFVLQRNKSATHEQAPPENVIFQPEGKMVSQSLDIKNEIESPQTTKNAQTTPDEPCYESYNYKCYSKYYRDLVKNSGAVVAIDDIKNRSEKNSTLLSICHPLMHVIGREASTNYKTVSEAFTKGDSFCWSGYHHGIMEGIIEKIGRENISSEINTICADVPNKENYTFDYYNCIHGLGHGIMAEFEDDVPISLKMCDGLIGNWEQQSCYSGVFMQNIIDSTNVANTSNTVKYLKPEDPMYPCNMVEEKYKEQCYLGQTSYALQVTGYNLKKVFDMCAETEQPYRNICNQSMGRDIANQASHEPRQTKNNCELPNDMNDTTNCIIGATKEIVSYYHSDKEAFEFCSILDTDYKNICDDVTRSYYSVFK